MYNVSCLECGEVYGLPLFLDKESVEYVGFKAQIGLTATVDLPGWGIVDGLPVCPGCARGLE